MFPLPQHLVIGYFTFEALILLLRLLTAHLLTYPYVVNKYETAAQYTGWGTFEAVLGWLLSPLAYLRVAIGYAMLRWLGWI